MENDAGGKNEALIHRRKAPRRLLAPNATSSRKQANLLSRFTLMDTADDGSTEEVSVSTAVGCIRRARTFGHDASHLQENSKRWSRLGYENDCGGFGDCSARCLRPQVTIRAE